MSIPEVVTIRLFGVLHALRCEQGLSTTIEIPVAAEGIPARAIAEDLDLPVDLIEGVFVNHKVYGLDHVVVPGDRVAFVPPGTPGPHRFFLGLYRAGQGDGCAESQSG
jgi:molybdopterin converting factor small subunit